MCDVGGLIDRGRRAERVIRRRHAQDLTISGLRTVRARGRRVRAGCEWFDILPEGHGAGVERGAGIGVIDTGRGAVVAAGAIDPDAERLAKAVKFGAPGGVLVIECEGGGLGRIALGAEDPLVTGAEGIEDAGVVLAAAVDSRGGRRGRGGPAQAGDVERGGHARDGGLEPGQGVWTGADVGPRAGRQRSHAGIDGLPGDADEGRGGGGHHGAIVVLAVADEGGSQRLGREELGGAAERAGGGAARLVCGRRAGTGDDQPHAARERAGHGLAGRKRELVSQRIGGADARAREPCERGIAPEGVQLVGAQRAAEVLGCAIADRPMERPSGRAAGDDGVVEPDLRLQVEHLGVAAAGADLQVAVEDGAIADGVLTEGSAGERENRRDAQD